jgi:type II secretory pathway pseudopilin PulG
MFRFSPVRRNADRTQRGYILLALIFAVTLLIIALATALPAIGTQIKRDREEELIHRGHQYVRAIQLYYRKFGRYPNSIDDLKDTNNMRFLRREYTDPITGKSEWRIIHFGEAQPKPIPPYMSRQGGAGGVSGGGLTGGTPAGSLAGGTGQNTGSGATNASSISQRLGSSTTTTGGIGPIVGVASTSDHEGLKEVDGKTKYSDWEFVYDPSLDTSRIAASNLTGGAGAGTGLNGPNNPTSNPTGNPTNSPNTPRPPGPNR